MSVPSAATRSPLGAVESTVINDRYRVDEVLGKGGMGEVLRVAEEATGALFALKRLLPDAKPKYAMLLQREFHTLFSLKHPNVVQAFDYGTSAGVPYYTMELLAGADVEALAPLAWHEVVPILRGVASALSLIHARHLVHRDVSARNVWRTLDGTVKLIDFGALTSFGAAVDIAGTPPYVAPEALRSRVLDQRTDLYALGALAYYLLTGRHAFPARTLGELEQHWSHGLVALSTQLAELANPALPEVPERLEQLIDSLLSSVAEARPGSAAEVLDGLALVLPDASGASQVAVEGILASKAFVGRVAERKRLRGLLERAQSHMGTSVALLGPQGIGRTRLLSELALDARVAGAVVVALAGDGDRSALSAAARAALKLLEASPSVARACAAPHASVLGHLSPELRVALDIGSEALERFPEMAGEARIRIQSALHAFWSAVCGLRPVALVIDDLESMDEASAALFATLGRDAAPMHMLVVAGVRTEGDATVPAVAQAFVEKALVLGLGALSADESTEMLRSMFGDAEHLSRTAQHLAAKAEGSPGGLMELCEYLVRSGKIRCSDGAWLLPQEMSELATPSQAGLEEARLGRLTPEQRSLARALSVVQGAVSLELCSTLSPLSPEQMFLALDQLCAEGVLIHGEHGYAFRRQPLRAALSAELNETEAKRVHAAIGTALLSGDSPTLLDRMTAGVHLLRAGNSERGAQVVHTAAVDAVTQMPEERSEIADQLEQAVVLLREHSLDDYQMLSFLCVLAWCGFFVDRRLGYTYGDEALACAQRVCGIDRARRLQPFLGRKLGLYVALICAAVMFRRRARKSPLVPSFKQAMRMLMLAAGSLSGMYTLCIARDKVLASVAAIEPLSALGDDHVASIIYRFGVCCVGTVSERWGETRVRWERLMARLDDPRPIKGLEANARIYYSAASMYAWGATECWRDNSRALEIADRLERQPLKLYQLSADQLRSVYYAQQGSQREAAYHRARVEMRALQRGMTWQVEIWEPSSALTIAARQQDAMAVKRAAGQLSHLSADTPSLRYHVEGARAGYLLLRGRYGEALEVLNALLPTRDPQLVGHANVIAQFAQAHNGLGQFAEAHALSSRALAELTPEDLAFPAMTLRLQIENALAQAGLGRHAEAGAQLDALIVQHTPNEGPLTLGALHDARASIALRAQQEEVARHHVEAMERWYRSTDCPSLIQHCDRIAKRWAKNRSRSGLDTFLPSMSFLANVGSKLTSSTIHEAPNEILAQLVSGAMANEGALFITSPEGLPVVVKSRAEELPEGLVAWVQERMSSALAFVTQTEDSDGAELVDPNVISFEAKTWRLFLLVSDQGASASVVGAVALCNAAAQVPLDVLRVLALHLEGELKSSLQSQWA